LDQNDTKFQMKKRFIATPATKQKFHRQSDYSRNMKGKSPAGMFCQTSILFPFIVVLFPFSAMK
jgi:hypothetical protein